MEVTMFTLNLIYIIPLLGTVVALTMLAERLGRKAQPALQPIPVQKRK